MGELTLGILARAIPIGEAGAHGHAAMPASCVVCPNRQFGFCAQLDAQTLGTLASRATHITVPAGQSLAESAGASEFGLLLRGYIRRVHYSADGKRQITGWVLKGEAYSLRGGSEQGELEAAKEIEICRIRASSYEKALQESSQFRRSIHQLARARVDHIQELTCALGALNPEQRVATLLINAAKIMPWQPLPDGGGILEIEFSRADIADFLGTTFESISRIVRKFHRKGLIRIHDPRHFGIADMAALARHVGLPVRAQADRVPAGGQSAAPT